MIRIMVIYLLLTAPAVAGCFNYAENPPAPRAEICYGNKCEKTTLEVECGNVESAVIEYSNGWHFGTSSAGDEAIRNGTLMDISLVSCRETDEGACGFLLDLER